MNLITLRRKQFRDFGRHAYVTTDGKWLANGNWVIAAQRVNWAPMAKSVGLQWTKGDPPPPFSLREICLFFAGLLADFPDAEVSLKTMSYTKDMENFVPFKDEGWNPRQQTREIKSPANIRWLFDESVGEIMRQSGCRTWYGDPTKPLDCPPLPKRQMLCKPFSRPDEHAYLVDDRTNPTIFVHSGLFQQVVTNEEAPPPPPDPRMGPPKLSLVR